MLRLEKNVAIIRVQGRGFQMEKEHAKALRSGVCSGQEAEGKATVSRCVGVSSSSEEGFGTQTVGSDQIV